MIYLIFSIICNVLLVFSFRVIKKLEINTFSVIVVNYITCYAVGMLLSRSSLTDVPFREEWFYLVFILGILFITVFYLLGKTAQEYGAGIASIANKLSLVIPVIAALYLYNESINIFKILGIMCALVAVYLSSGNNQHRKAKTGLWLPLLVFIGSGIIDTMINFIQKTYLGEKQPDYLMAILFGTAGITGILSLLPAIILKRLKPEWRSLPAGIIVGLINYGSLYFLFKTLNNGNWESSSVFPVNNIGIVMLSVLGGVYFFGEKLSRKNVYGIIMAILAIVLIAFSGQLTGF